ncbi:MAG: adenosylhomocysteinase, partial [Ruminococcaceae bacterium]|nr:adenosylhomocysteinase [Oscillospiraceae bacterium]
GIQAKSLEYLVNHAGKLENRVYAVPAETDRAVAEIKLAAMQMRIDHLTPEQAAYLEQVE